MGAKRRAWLPAWVMTVHAMAAEPACHVRAHCVTCKEWVDVDLQALADKVGPDYSLVNRRSPCRLTAGCDGWVTFMYLGGVYRALSTIEREEIWMERDRRARAAKGQ